MTGRGDESFIPKPFTLSVGISVDVLMGPKAILQRQR